MLCIQNDKRWKIIYEKNIRMLKSRKSQMLIFVQVPTNAKLIE